MQIPSTTAEFLPTTDLANGSPKTMYLFFLLNLCSRYFDAMKGGQVANIDAATAALVSFCPDRKTREALWNRYTEEKKKDDGNIVTASALTIGELISYLSDTMEFLETATGGFA